ncbi:MULTISPECIES: DUF350 domain-containing protein [unclassified Agarivorans]|uniref:DUF350 domain-containing protein n=1 Tax=unclassified Agarivorans TaxID=2636026 RepID=UPI0010E61188|nr:MULTISPECIES: DUF350 domain-containing protein [unclassified Agarivorans]MDO6684573.1 DUF350 domain-containing protein [Agarivorans sp. 3_MG-2023]MDO6714738.1 DUF350 domain-containing protein [Agarivorans sp. 2_MG-2023]MDO6762869.1 DUF350 domain-containing protein [Agarivorans sp. 1_MG-2023]GDY24683.1 DUF350 domain-containing protein [Agarivorans sp. Toyoura001]
MEQSELLMAVANFAIYFAASIVFLMLFKVIYVRVTPHDEWELIKEGKNTSAAIAFGGAVLGFALALAGAASNSISFVDFTLWGAIALIAQIAAFVIVRFVFIPGIVSRIEANEVSAGIMLAATSVSVGMLNAACMTY